MKKTLVALAALAATAAFAQSSVTIDGVMDMGLVKPQGAAVANSSARIDASNGMNQIRFSGSEDLGGGLRATFRAALRFSPESGGQDGSTNGRVLFQGESRVGLAGSFGSVVIGRGLTAFQGPVNNSDPWGTIQQASVATIVPAYVTDPAGNPNGGGAGRTDAITYNSPAMGGFSAAVSLAPSTSASSGAVVKQAKTFSSAWVGFANGPLTLGAGFENNRAGDKAVAFNGSYNLGVARIAAGYGTTDAAATAGTKGKGYNLGLWVPMGAATIKAGYGVYKAEGTGVTATQKLGLGVDYSLSKRTMIYASYGNNSKAAAGTTKSGWDVGVRHNF